MATQLEGLRKALSSPQPPPVVLIGGENDALRMELVEAAIQSIDEGDRGTGIDRFENQPMARILDAARTRPLLGGQRLVLAFEPEGLFSGSEQARDSILSYLEAPPDHALLVLVTTKIDKRLKVVKAVARAGLVFECGRPKEREMPGWVAQRAQEMGLRLGGDAVQLIADAVGNDTGLATRELEKISLIADPRGQRPVTAQEAEQVLAPGRAVGAFALEDALLTGSLKPALAALDRHLTGSSHSAPLALLARLASICRRLVSAGAVVESGGGPDDVRAALGCHPFVAKKYAQAARRQARNAESALVACVAADGMLKSGRDPREALTRIVVALAPAPQRRGRR